MVATSILTALGVIELPVSRSVPVFGPQTKHWGINLLSQCVCQLGGLFQGVRHVGMDEDLGIRLVIDSGWRSPVTQIPAAVELLLQVVIRFALRKLNPLLDCRVVASYQRNVTVVMVVLKGCRRKEPAPEGTTTMRGSGGCVVEAAVLFLAVQPVAGKLAIEGIRPQKRERGVQGGVGVATITVSFSGMAVYLVTSQHETAQRVIHHRVDPVQGLVRTTEGTYLRQIRGDQVSLDVIRHEFTLGGVLDQDVSATGIVETVSERFDAAAPADVLAGLPEAIQFGQLPCWGRGV